MSSMLASRLKRVERRIVGSPQDRLARLSDAELDDLIAFLRRRVREEEGQIVAPHSDDKRAARLYANVRPCPADLMARYGLLSDDERDARISYLLRDLGVETPYSF
jgi:hypothetical protein